MILLPSLQFCGPNRAGTVACPYRYFPRGRIDAAWLGCQHNGGAARLRCVELLLSLWRSYGKIDDLGYLAPGGAGVWPELEAAAATGVSGDNRVGVGGLDESVERVCVGHVPECWCWRCVDGPGFRIHDDLAQLPSCNFIAGSELQAPRSTVVPRDNTLVIGRLYVAVEGVVRGYVLEGR